MWGTPYASSAQRKGQRFIPTHVGNTPIRAKGKRFISVHPHACGEHPPPTGAAASGNRFIPTHVGNTPTAVWIWPSSSVHPHACGEHISSSVPSNSFFGSSPRMWGTQPTKPPQPGGWRFIPTHVGNTMAATLLGTDRPVHPHACGEHAMQSGYDKTNIGSSPRMWGTRLSFQKAPNERRFIPTHVGNTRWFGGGSPILAVHPHACGEHCRYPGYALPVRGSSPRMWGTQPIRIPKKAFVRFIPTHVGNT